jgi:N-acetyl-beta-hexosaminidase
MFHIGNNHTTSCSLRANEKVQAVGVRRRISAPRNIQQLFLENCTKSLDKRRKQPMMWAKVGQSGSQ